jgi:hypothetical protein
VKERRRVTTGSQERWRCYPRTTGSWARSWRAAEPERGNPTTFHVLGILYKRSSDRAATDAAFRGDWALGHGQP